jgi:hypothetical protein
MIDKGEQTVTGMAKIIGVHRVTLHKALKRTADFTGKYSVAT